MTVPAPGQCLPFFLMIKVIYTLVLEHCKIHPIGRKGKRIYNCTTHCLPHIFGTLLFSFFPGHRILKGIQENKLVCISANSGVRASSHSWSSLLLKAYNQGDTTTFHFNIHQSLRKLLKKTFLFILYYGIANYQCCVGFR